jgi:hypothetical protein
VWIEVFRLLFPRISISVKPEYFFFFFLLLPSFSSSSSFFLLFYSFSSSSSIALHSSADLHSVNFVFALPFQFFNLHIFIFLHAIPPSVFCRPINRLSGDYYLLLDLNFLLLSILAA